MTDREKLVALLVEAESLCAAIDCYDGAVCEYAGEIDGCAAFRADHLIANGVVVREWIPVTERLPVAQGYYMVYHKNSKIIAERFYYKDCPDLFVEVTGDPVTHWMPLPEPPKEGE